MKTALLALVLTIAATPALAAKELKIDDLAAETGLTTRQVAMVLGPHTAYTEYRASYDHVKRRFVEAIGRSRFDTLMAAWKAQQQGRVYVQRVQSKDESGT